MEDGQDATEVPAEHIGLQEQITADATTGNSMKSHMEVQTVTDIAKGLRESLKNIHDYRKFMHEEIKDILKRPTFTIDRKAMPDRWTLTGEED
jgi:hypothetical protein